MKISRNDRDGVVMLSVSGKLTGGADADRFQEVIAKLLDEGERCILVELSDVSWVNSTGLGILIAARKAVVDAGGRLKLCKVSKRVDDILMVTRLNTIFETYDDEAQAIASF